MSEFQPDQIHYVFFWRSVEVHHIRMISAKLTASTSLNIEIIRILFVGLRWISSIVKINMYFNFRL
jgi:hypothetical protein